MKCIGYAIILSDHGATDDAMSLGKNVMALLDEDKGWEPIGGVVVLQSPSGPRLAQTMERYEKA